MRILRRFLLRLIFTDDELFYLEIILKDDLVKRNKRLGEYKITRDEDNITIRAMRIGNKRLSSIINKIK